MRPIARRSLAPAAQATLIFVFAFSLLTGCTSVTTDQPLSADPKPLDKEKFEGLWRLDNAAVAIRFAENGIGRVAAMKWKDDRFQLIQAEIIIAHGNNFNFLSFRAQHEGAWPDHYTFLQYKFTDDGDLILWPPNPDAFSVALETNALQGAITKEKHSTDIRVTSPTDVLLAFMDNPERLDLFNYREPVVLKKLAAAEQAEK